MKVKLNKPFGPARRMDEKDVRTLKTALNHLGYYQPPEGIGLSNIADQEIIDAVTLFQKDQDLTPDSEVHPGGETENAINTMYGNLLKDGTQYIWRTVGDGRVRPSHAALDGTLQTFGEGPAPGEEPNCRCKAEPVPKRNCDEERAAVAEAENKVRDLTDKFHNLLLQLNGLREEQNKLVEKSQKNLGGQVVAYILTLPLKKTDALNELLRRYFGGIISDEFLKAADSFMRQSSALKQKMQHLTGQAKIVLVRLNAASEELEEAKKRLEECEKNAKG